MMTFEDEFVLVKQGAEAKIFRGRYLGQPTIVKERFKKKYRHSDLDEHLTKERIKSEARSIVRCKLAGLHTPTIYLVDFVRRRIYMQDFTDSLTVKDYIIEICQGSGTSNGFLEEQIEKLDSIAEKIGKVVGKMHANNIIHGDLTTSNMLLVKNQSGCSELVLIDFGLSYSESVSEDKGVDLYVLERAILSTHTDASSLFPNIISAYLKENSGKGAEVIKKLDDVRARGRKRTMVG